MKKDTVAFLVDTTSFPKKCAELQDLCNLLNDHWPIIYTEKTPTAYFNEAMELTEKYELVIPVTRNLYIRDKLRMEGVSLIVCL